jgi:hypothetical protein
MNRSWVRCEEGRPTPPSGGGGAGGATVSLDRPQRITLARFLSRGMRVTGSCTSGSRGTLKLVISGRQARALRLRGRSLAVRAVRCNGNGLSARLTPTAKAKRALRRARGSVQTTVRAIVGSAGASRRVVLRRS